MMSTRHVGELVDTGKINFSTKYPIIKPDVIKDYNKLMGGVDTLSHVIKPNSIQKHGLKWYRKIGELFIDISMYNAFILWKQLNPTRKESNQERIQLCVQIQNPLRLTERHFPDQKNQQTGRKKSKCVVCNMNGIRREVIYECRPSDKALCVVPCFKLYHTIKNLVANSIQD